MAGKQVQRRRGSTAQTAVFTGAVGEITVDTDKKTAVVHDGVTAGGFPLARITDVIDVGGDADAAMAAAVAAQTSANTGIANAATAQTQANLGVSKADTAQAEVDALETVVADLDAHSVPRDNTTGAATIPVGNNAQRPVAPVEGQFRYNSQLTRFEGYQNGQWAQVGGDSLPIFFTTWCPNRAAVPAGFVVADGQLLSRATYPDAAAAISAGNVPTVADATWLSTVIQRGRYTLGDGSTTFRMPDYNGKYTGSLGAVFLRGDGAMSAGTNGALQLDELKSHAHTYGSATSKAADGAVHGTAINQGAYATSSTGGAETRPLNVTGCWVVKLFGAVINPGAVDAAQLASDMANMQATAYQRSNILGAVSQAAGVPTGALMDTGSNANGRYIKYADGTLICWFYTSTQYALTTSYGSQYISGNITLAFPVGFVGTPMVVPSAITTPQVVWAAIEGSASTAAMAMRLIGVVNGATSYAGYIAIGRWF
jgi:hypothetical protein